MYLGCAPAGPA
ncbi:unnamed protein product, partial [Rotaria magnacalcarata]